MKVPKKMNLVISRLRKHAKNRNSIYAWCMRQEVAHSKTLLPIFQQVRSRTDLGGLEVRRLRTSSILSIINSSKGHMMRKTTFGNEHMFCIDAWVSGLIRARSKVDLTCVIWSYYLRVLATNRVHGTNDHFSMRSITWMSFKAFPVRFCLFLSLKSRCTGKYAIGIV